MYIPKFEPHKHRMLYGFGPMKPNTKLSWWPWGKQPDSKEAFDENMKDPKKRAILAAAGFDKTPIEYRSNEQGFRMDMSLYDVPAGGSVYIGCSHTFGVGLNVEDTWAWKMAKARGDVPINLSQPAGGFETQYRLLKSWIDIIKPSRVYSLGSYQGRREFVSGFGGDAIRRNTTHYDLGEMGFIGFEEAETFLSDLRCIDAMRATCIENSAELYLPPCEIGRHIQFTIWQKHSQAEYARDLSHFSPQWHTSIAERPESWWIKAT